ncbi:TauD/TfdA family dioxygenase [Streptomyces sp. TS71-3]|uniref:TauD/TfdA family dioxygenase n=1 Tax=Streptomyces sp. TS71-3 TaxID=2733862 RepID=UPI001B28B363|nr:TauD/TfdA family dioxygenase [Streptomyces sp. TS71-3]GHJ39959.1 hypothetical protein Sm713_55680 [Streptomyces sp. TS71-3]
MRRARQPYVREFARYRIDLTTMAEEAAIAARLRDVGLVSLDGLTSRSAVLAFAARIMDLARHRDSDSDGLTAIRDTGRHAHREGFAGFGDGELALHTDRSGTPDPPRLVLLVCGKAADQGGECLLTDGKAVHTQLITGDREAAQALAQPRTTYFGDGDGQAAEVFTIHRDHRVSVRLRLDGLARWTPTVEPYVPLLRATAVQHQISLALAPGQGYLLDNERWLHGRRAFVGDRLCWRALGYPRFPMPRGFMPARSPVPRPVFTEAG